MYQPRASKGTGGDGTPNAVRIAGLIRRNSTSLKLVTSSGSLEVAHSTIATSSARHREGLWPATGSATVLGLPDGDLLEESGSVDEPRGPLHGVVGDRGRSGDVET